MTAWYGSGGMDPFEEMLARFFGTRAHRRPTERINLARLMSEPARELVRDAATQAAQWGSRDLDADHLLWAATRQQGTRHWLERAGADPDAIQHEIENHAYRGEPREVQPELTPAAKRALLDSHQVSRALGSSYIGPEHLLFALALDRGSSAGRILDAAHVTPDSLKSAAGGGGQPPANGGGEGRSDTPTLDEFGRDLTALAREGRIDPVIGRDEEIEETVEVLSRRTKNNPVLIGDPGVGKTAIAEGLAQRIVDDDIPETLRNKRIVQLDLSGVVAGTRYRGDFEERLKKVVDEIREHADELVVFIDEIHTLVGAGGAEGAMTAGNMLKPALARGELHVVGATTVDEYRRNIEKDAALERRFQPIMVPEPSTDDSIEILRGLRDRYEAHHQVRYTDESLVAAVDLSSRYLTDRFLPDKAIDLIDQAGARVRLRSGTRDGGRRELEDRLDRRRREKDQAVADEDYEKAKELRDEINRLQTDLAGMRDDHEPVGVPEVTTEDIAEVVSRISGVPVTQLTQAERERLSRLEEHLHERVIGQEDAVAAVARAVRRSRAGMGDPDRPIGGFLFLGPTGVGKTELAKALAEALFGSQDRMIRFDMSEFQERHTVSRLMGAPPGYVGYEEAGQLTDAVRRQPYSVILLDEIEKAHQDVFNVLLQLLDDGRLTDAQGRTVDFRNTVVIMTSNLGSDLITGRTEIGFGGREGEDTALRDRIMRRLRESFRPEFLNRIDEIIVFQRLEAGQLRQITDLLLDETRRRLRAQGVTVSFTPEAVDWIAERGHQPEFGARPLRRTIQREVDDQLSDLLLSGDLAHGRHVEVSAAPGGLQFDVSTSASPSDQPITSR
ncbi:ATP-dependent Clp protease ATP-binding subunit [Actinomadura montaniterrae]|uniref:ATP-dependent Clp protease ATP-binding subunit n=1 Tax=Actinomadura montaniterrae TaxID=1803903 RepID=A0A6L3VYR7_9ACTN|nr:ATP-dependent Clp protease ATP-binding subunit [Actinomadura montaniterrae]KAB2386100.1 ATP-dependent Clp protease ATP-binding subunit [Actinomadura montaniterrae]